MSTDTDWATAHRANAATHEADIVAEIDTAEAAAMTAARAGNLAGAWTEHVKAQTARRARRMLHGANAAAAGITSTTSPAAGFAEGPTFSELLDQAAAAQAEADAPARAATLFPARPA